MQKNLNFKVSFNFNHLPTHTLTGVKESNADLAVRKGKSELLARLGYQEEDLRKCIISTSRETSDL